MSKQLLKMAIYSEFSHYSYGGSFHSYVNVYQMVTINGYKWIQGYEDNPHLNDNQFAGSYVVCCVSSFLKLRLAGICFTFRICNQMQKGYT